MCLGALPASISVDCVWGGREWLQWRPKEDAMFPGTGVIDMVVRVRVPILLVRKVWGSVLALFLLTHSYNSAVDLLLCKEEGEPSPGRMRVS